MRNALLTSVLVPGLVAGHDRLQPTLEIRTAGGRQLYWEFEHPGGVTTRATGTGSTTGRQVSLSGRQTTGTGYSTHMTYTFELTRDGDTLGGTSMGPNNLPVKVEFTRERR